MGNKKIPIVTAQTIGKEFEKNQVIIVTWCAETGVHTVTTWGKSLVDCDQAALGGDVIKEALGWPEKAGKLPSRVKKLQEEVKKSKFKQIPMDFEVIPSLN